MFSTAHPLRALLTLLAAGLLASCMQLAPRYERPPAPMPAQFPGADAAAGEALAADLPWQDYFTDPALRTLIGTALRNNRDLRIAALNIEAAQAQLQLRRADRLPALNAGVTSLRQTGNSGNTTGLYTAGFSVSAYELDLFGRLHSLSDAAAAQLLGTEQARRAVQISLVASVASQYLALTATEELLDLTRRTLGTREESLKLTQLKVEHGASSDLELRQAQTLVEAARATLAQLRRQRELERNALALLLGQALPELPPRPGALDATALADLPAGLPSDLLLRRPDLLQAEHQLIAAHANIGAARAAFWPRISLTGSVGTASTQLLGLFKDGAWSFAAQLLQPIFDAGRNQANLAVAEVQREVALAQYERAIQAAFREVADALAGRATLQDQLRALQAQASAEQARFVLSELRFNNGVSSSLELLDAQRALFAAQQAVLSTRLALLQNQVALYRALGGGALAGAGR